MTLLVTVFAAVIATALWYKTAPKSELRLGILCWLFPLQGRFDSPLKDALKTSAFLTFRHLPSTVILVLLTVETAVSLIEKWWPVFFAPALWALLCSLFMERIFPKYLPGGGGCGVFWQVRPGWGSALPASPPAGHGPCGKGACGRCR